MLLLSFICITALRAAPEYPEMGPDVYDSKADGNVLIASALKKASAEHQNVLVVFGANWCVWCHRLHTLLATNREVAQVLRANYQLVEVDVNTRNGVKRNADVDERFGHPIQFGLPALVVLDPTGKLLKTEDSGELEDGKDGHDPAKVVTFLETWKPKAAKTGTH